MDIKEIYKKIDQYDVILADTYAKRLNALRTVAQYKSDNKLPIIDELRNAAIIASAEQVTEDDKLRPYVKNFMEEAVEISNSFIRNHMQQHIFIIGMPGAGKTTVGRALAERLGMDFHDVDEEIQKKTGKTIQNIIIYDGEDKFRQFEYDAIGEILRQKPSVIATGGGTVMSDETVTLMKNNGIIVFVHRGVQSILEDLDLEIRPLVKESIEYIFRVYEERYPIYERVCNIKIANESSVSDTVQAIVEALPKAEK